jgi:NAD(P)-dependent dehydrogenase (short-subunit alcohol dehydrogenase family)
MSDSKTVIVLGASRGIGLGLVNEYLSRGWSVIATERGNTTQSRLLPLVAGAAGRLTVANVDINEPAQVSAFAEKLGGITADILFVVAGVTDDPAQTIAEISDEEFAYVMRTNALSPLRALAKLDAHVKPDGQIAVLSTGLASISTNTTGGYETYRASKAALNMSLRSYAARSGAQRTILAMMPGWVKTDMGGPDALVEIHDSAAGLADTVERRAGQPGVVFVDYENQEIPW